MNTPLPKKVNKQLLDLVKFMFKLTYLVTFQPGGNVKNGIVSMHLVPNLNFKIKFNVAVRSTKGSSKVSNLLGTFYVSLNLGTPHLPVDN